MAVMVTVAAPAAASRCRAKGTIPSPVTDGECTACYGERSDQTAWKRYGVVDPAKVNHQVSQFWLLSPVLPPPHSISELSPHRSGWPFFKVFVTKQKGGGNPEKFL